LTRDWRYEAVAFARKRFYEARILRVVVQRLPDFVDTQVDAPVEIHEILAPKRTPDFVAGDDFA
jgi:hypothetical protein